MNWKLRALLTILICGILVGSIFSYSKLSRQYRYPYGWSHCCIKQFDFYFKSFAETHNGHFPAGESCPEASLSLLYRENNECNAELLRGKTVPVANTKAVLDRGELLSPESCGWYYVEGLTTQDDPSIMILWDKVGLGHNGERGYHSALLLGGGEVSIPNAEWPKLLEENEKRIVESKKKRENKKTSQ